MANGSSAGLPIEKVSGTRTSVYSGVFNNDWQHLQYKDGEKCKTSTALGVQPCLFANRVSWFFNLTGNSANIDTACSSSLVCLDLACRDLLSGSEDMVGCCHGIFFHRVADVNRVSLLEETRYFLQTICTR